MPEKNALVELAKKLKSWICVSCCKRQPSGHIATSAFPELDKAQRIIAELAKVEDVIEVHNLELVKLPSSWQCIDAVVKCRAIAEEGVENGKQNTFAEDYKADR